MTPDPQRDAERLGELARIVEPASAIPPREARARLVEAVSAGQGKPRRSWQHWGVGATAMAAACVVLLFVLRPAPLQFVVDGQVAQAGSHVETPSDRTTQLAFSDRSLVTLAAETRARVISVDAHGAQLALEHGEAKLDITPNQSATWAVKAGSYRVRVVGTILTVQYRGAGTLTVTVSKGAVRVHGPLVPDGIIVRAQHRFSVAKDGEDFELVDISPSKDATTAPVPTEPTADPSITAAPSASWSELVKRGDHQAVLDAAEARGLDAVYEQASSNDLEALAVAAQQLSRSDIATRALEAQHERFADSAAAKAATFQLAKLAEKAGKISQAVAWYQRYLTESPGGALHAEAMGRRMLLVHRSGGDAWLLADSYLRRYPQGAYATTARSVIRKH